MNKLRLLLALASLAIVAAIAAPSASAGYYQGRLNWGGGYYVKWNSGYGYLIWCDEPITGNYSFYGSSMRTWRRTFVGIKPGSSPYGWDYWRAYNDTDNLTLSYWNNGMGSKCNAGYNRNPWGGSTFMAASGWQGDRDSSATSPSW